MTDLLASFAQRLGAQISSGFPLEDDPFNRLALELFGLQFGRNAPLRKLCEFRGVTPATVKHWSAIPALPTSAFKELPVTCLSEAERTHCFHSSGTTRQTPSRHFHHAASLVLYKASLWPWFEAHLLKGFNGRLLLLVPPPKAAPHSSLVHMLDTVARRVPKLWDTHFATVTASGAWELDLPRLEIALEEAAALELPLLLLGTAFSFVHLLDYLQAVPRALSLPLGSRAMETGGYKGRSRTLAREDLHRLMHRKLSLPHSSMVCEYGMSELSSQAYDGIADNAAPPRLFRFPQWARVRVISPETGEEVADGAVGLLRVVDLANAFSTLAVQTEDLARRRGDGFELLGRAANAELRGCSLLPT